MIKVVRDSSGNPQYVELSEAERKCGRENYDFYCFLIWPFIESSWLGAVSLLGLTPPLDGSQDVWLDMKKAQDSAQIVSISQRFSPHFATYLTSHSLAKHYITKETFPTSRQSTRRRSRTHISDSRRRESFLLPRTKSPALGRRSDWRPNGPQRGIPRPARFCLAVVYGTLLN